MINLPRVTSKKHFGLLLIVLPCGLILLILISLCLGQYNMTPWTSAQILITKIFHLPAGNWDPIAEKVILNLRLPRTLAAAAVGAALAVSGATYQGIFRNPLVSPDFLGVSSGACIGAALAILMGLNTTYIQGFAFIGGVIAVATTFSIPKMLKSDSNIMLVLSGIIVGGLLGSIMGLLKYVADPETQLATITYWQMGSFAYVRFNDFLSVLPLMIFGFVVLFAMAWWIDIISLGESEAHMLGANVKLIRGVAVFCATLLTASAVCISGTIGWVGLVIPHFSRMLTGNENTKLLPIACFCGAIFMVLVDLCARCLTTLELPISILTGIIGAPFYAWILYKQRTQLR
ncbi:MAG: iron ABC transporter permease [Clostridiales bacterium]